MFAFSCSCSVIALKYFRKLRFAVKVTKFCIMLIQPAHIAQVLKSVGFSIPNYFVFTGTEVIEEKNEFIYFCITYSELTLKHRSY